MPRILWLRPICILCWLAVLSCEESTAQEANAPQQTSPTIVVNVNRVLVPVVVRDKQGRTVDDLKRENFQLFDNDKPREIAGISIERRGPAQSVPIGNAESSTPPPSGTGTAPQSSPPSQRFVVFLFDDMHLTYADLARVEKAAAKAVVGSLADSDIAAVVSTSGKTNSGLTRDHAKLQDAITGLRPNGLTRVENADCPNIDYYQADLMVNKHDSSAISDAIAQVFSCDPGLDPQHDFPVAQRLAEEAGRRAQAIGYQDAEMALATVAEIVRRMAALPGQRTLILVSPGFLNVEADTLTAESHIIDSAAQSNVTISTLDSRGLYTTSLTASEDTHLMPIATKSEFHASGMRAAENVLAEFADGTGGTFFHNNNDLDVGLKHLTEAPECVYMLELSLDNVKPDGSYHRLTVKVDRDGAQLRSRRGYFMPKPKKDKK